MAMLPGWSSPQSPYLCRLGARPAASPAASPVPVRVLAPVPVRVLAPIAVRVLSPSVTRASAVCLVLRVQPEVRSDLPHLLMLIGQDEAGGDSRGARSAGAAGAVHVGVAVPGGV